MPEFDFGFNGNVSSDEPTVDKKTDDDATDIDSGNQTDPKTGDEVVDINDNKNPDDKSTTDTDVDDKDTKKDKDKTKDTKKTDEPLAEGTVIEYNDKKYTVDENGNLVSEDGKVFKKADKVNEWLKSFETEEVDADKVAEVDVKSIQKAMGIELQDENGKPVEFENTTEGLHSYVKAVMDNSRQSIIDETIDALYAKYPILENVINYYVANGNSLEGFNELKDRSKITLDTNNEAQCEAIIREAWKEDNRRGNVDNYIQYLKTQNLLGSTAEEELQAMADRDKHNAEELARKAEEQEKADIEAQTKYWNTVNKQITVDKKLGKYQLPDTIIRVHDGKKTSATPQDFFNYIYQVDKNGRSAYENDLIKDMKENPQARMTDDIIAAYLRYTGGSYESLVKMAINEEKVKTIKIKAATSVKSKPKVNTPPKPKTKNLDFGF